MKLREKHIAALQTHLEQLLPSQDLPGQLLYYYQRYRISRDTHYQKRAEAILVELCTQVVTRKTTDSRTLRELLLSDVCQDTAITSARVSRLTSLDEYLVNQAGTWIANCTLQGWYAAAVVGRYLLLRKDYTYLRRLVTAWGETHQRSSVHLPTNPLLTYQGVTPLGFEGISGLLLLLITIEQTVHEEVLRKIIREGIRVLLSYRNEVDFSSQHYAMFPRFATSDEAPRPLAWGGSDLAQALLLYRAYDLFQDQQLRRTADLVGLNTLLRKEKDHLLTHDETVYGGAAGVAQTYAALYALSGREAYQTGYKHWLKQVITSLNAQSYARYTGKEYDLHDGLLGIYLVLLSYRGETQTDWPRVLLLK